MGIPERREREFLRRETEILEAARELFTTDQAASVTVEQIADRAEIGKGTVYKHFASKDEIYARLWMDFFEGMTDRIRAVDPTLDVLNRLRAIIAAIWEHHRDHTDYQRIIEYCERAEFRNGLPEAVRQRMNEVEEQTNAAIVATVREGVEEGLFPHKPAEELTFGPRAALIGANRLVLGETMTGAGESDRFLEQLTDFTLAGMMYQDRVKPAPAVVSV